MQERSEEQIISRLLELENSGQAERRAELSGERYIALIQDPETSGGYILQHGLDETEGAEVPEGTEFWDYETRVSVTPRPAGPRFATDTPPATRIRWSPATSARTLSPTSQTPKTRDKKNDAGAKRVDSLCRHLPARSLGSSLPSI